MSGVAGHDQCAAAIGFQTLCAMKKRKRRVFTAIQETSRAIRNLRVLFDNQLDVFLIRLGRCCLHNFVVKIHCCSRP